MNGRLRHHGLHAGEGTYQLTYGGSGSRVVFVVSEPITASSSDWVAVRLRFCLYLCWKH